MRTNVSTCVADNKCLSRAGRVPNSLRGKSSLSLGLGPGLRRDDGSRAGIKGKEKDMKNFLFVLMGVFAFSGAFAAGENVPTSKSYVDSKLAEKQDNITATDAPRAIMNTGVAGEYDTRGIYDSTDEYSDQTRALVDAQSMNTGVQNAIDSEFQCIEWLDPNDHSSDCLLMDLSVARYAGYDIFNGKKDSRLFYKNFNSIVSFDENTKIITMLLQKNPVGNGYIGNASSTLYFATAATGPRNFINGHKYYFYAKMRKTSSDVTNVRIYRDTAAKAYFKNVTTEWEVSDVIFEAKYNASDGAGHYSVLEASSSEPGQGIMIDQNYVGVYDLTKIFGAGNEPATTDASARALLLLHMPAAE